MAVVVVVLFVVAGADEVVVAEVVVADLHLGIAADQWPLVVVLEEGAEVSGRVGGRRRREVHDPDVFVRRPAKLDC